MKIKVIFVIAWMGLTVMACSESNTDTKDNVKGAQLVYNPNIGVGEFGDFKTQVEIKDELVVKGKELYDAKCASCHSVNEDVIVGPGWAKITERKELSWIMNFMTNTSEMLEKDPDLKKQIEKYKVQMPELSTSKEDARAILEFMRSNDEL